MGVFWKVFSGFSRPQVACLLIFIGESDFHNPAAASIQSHTGSTGIHQGTNLKSSLGIDSRSIRRFDQRFNRSGAGRLKGVGWGRRRRRRHGLLCGRLSQIGLGFGSRFDGRGTSWCVLTASDKKHQQTGGHSKHCRRYKLSPGGLFQRQRPSRKRSPSQSASSGSAIILAATASMS